MIGITVDAVKAVKYIRNLISHSFNVSEYERRLEQRRDAEEQRQLDGEERRLRVGCNFCVYRKNGQGVLELMELKSTNFNMLKDVLGQEMAKHLFKRKTDNKTISHVNVLKKTINDVEFLMSFRKEKYERLGSLVDYIVADIMKHYVVQPIPRRSKERRSVARTSLVACGQPNKMGHLMPA